MKASWWKFEGRPTIPSITPHPPQDGEMVWQREGASPIRCPGTAGSSCPHTHEAGGATRPGSAVISPRHKEQLAADGEDDEEDAPVRDGDFYIDGADCVIRVEDTLFRVSGALLSPRWLPLPPAARCPTLHQD